jgi:hypothetical protein
LGAGLSFVLGGVLGAGLLVGLGGVLGAGLATGLIVGLGGVLGAGLRAGLTFGLVYKLYAGLAAGLSSGEITTKAMPNEGIHRSARMALVSGLGAGLGAGLVVGLPAGLVVGLPAGLGIGLATGLRYGGRACLQHLLLRLELRYQGFAPWQYVDFLDEAAERLFLRKVGGGYSFIHRLLQDHFATRYAEPGNGAHPETAGQGQSAAS